jgi:hypothetical protein
VSRQPWGRAGLWPDKGEGAAQEEAREGRSARRERRAGGAREGTQRAADREPSREERATPAS